MEEETFEYVKKRVVTRRCDTCKKELSFDEYLQIDTTHTDGWEEFGMRDMLFCSSECVKNAKYLGLSCDKDDIVTIKERLSVANFKTRFGVNND